MENTKKLTGKDLINVGIYTAMTLVIFFVVGLLTALPVVYPFLFIIWPIVCGIPMMLYYTKIQKFGMLTITGIIGGIFFYLIGYGWIGLLGWVLGGILSDVVLKIGGYQKFKATVLSYYLVPYADRILYMKHGSIVREFTGTEFQKLSPDELQGMGLRALDPFHLPPEAAPKPAAPKLHIKGFQFSYEKHGPLNVDIPDLTLPQGEIIGIIGNNGAGKSTFARCLCGLDKKAKGVLEMDGTPYDAKQRRHISYMVMQDVNHQLFTEDVLDELLLSMGGEDEKADTARAKEILNSLDLLDKVKLHPMSLSGGEKQRVAIGSAIASDKKILIFDEPTSGLDYRHMLEVSDNLNRLKEMGKSLFLITHDPELIYKCCTYLLFIQGSKVLWHRPMDGEAVKLLRAFFSHEQETGAVNAS